MCVCMCEIMKSILVIKEKSFFGKGIFFFFSISLLYFELLLKLYYRNYCNIKQRINFNLYTITKCNCI